MIFISVALISLGTYAVIKGVLGVTDFVRELINKNKTKN